MLIWKHAGLTLKTFFQLVSILRRAWLSYIWHIRCTESDMRCPYSHIVIRQLRGFALKTLVSVAMLRIHPKLFLLIHENRLAVFFSHGILLNALWQILMRLQCLSGHMIVLFIVYTLCLSLRFSHLKSNEAVHETAFSIFSACKHTGVQFSCLLLYSFRAHNYMWCCTEAIWAFPFSFPLPPMLWSSLSTFGLLWFIPILPQSNVQIRSCSLLAVWVWSQYNNKELKMFFGKTIFEKKV